jgi:type I restriction enzyme S subunit
MKGHDLEVPSGWRKAPLGEQVTLEYGASLPVENRRDGNVVVLGSSGVIGRHNKALQQGPGIVVGRKGTVGSLTWVNGPYWPIDTTYFVKPLVEARLPWLFRALSLVGLDRLDSSTGVPGLNRNDAYPIPVLVPDLAEQACIAEVLDTLDEAIFETEALVEKLLAAKQGLLMDTFEANIQSTAVPLGYYLQGIDAGKSPDCPEMPAQAGEWGVLKVSAVVRSGFRPNENKAVLNPVHFNAAYEVHIGDLLITRANTYDLIAQACVVREAPPRLMLCDKTLRLKPNQKASAEFLSIALTTPTARRHIEIHATGSSGTMKNITQGAIRAIPVPNLDRAKQDQLTSQMAALVARIEAETEQMNKLKSIKSGLSADLLSGHVRTINP